jgi:hypothetical protein
MIPTERLSEGQLREGLLRGAKAIAQYYHIKQGA